jgi:hypothetical protein
MFDETSRVPIVTSFAIRAFCLVRIVYHRRPEGSVFTTENVLEHEEKHFEIIATAWQESIGKLASELEKLGHELNRKFDLWDAEIFRVEKVTRKIPWQIRQQPAENESEKKTVKILLYRAVPVGQVAQVDHVLLFHSNPLHEQVIYRVIRRQVPNMTVEEMAELIKKEKQTDPNALNALDGHFGGSSSDWNNWLKATFVPGIKFEFERRFIGDGLRLDAAEGAFDSRSGKLQPQPGAQGILKRFRDKTEGKGNSNKNPSQELERILEQTRGN